MVPQPVYDLLLRAAWPIAVAGAATALCYAAAGETLGFYLGPVMMITLVLPSMIVVQSRLRDAAIIAGAMMDAVGLAWLIAVFGPNLTFLQWLACYVVLAAYAFALTALTRVTAAWIAVLVGVAWLAWPLWTAPFLDITLARWLTPGHPLMTINGVLLATHGAWLEQPLMYQYATLGQDVPYALPRSIWPCVIVHTLIGLLLLAPQWWRARERARGQTSAAAAEEPAAPVA